MTPRTYGAEPVLLMHQDRTHESELLAESGEAVARRCQIIGSAQSVQLATELLHVRRA